jgi:hypothetical protein
VHVGESSDSKKESKGADGQDGKWKMGRKDGEVGRGGDVGSSVITRFDSLTLLARCSLCLRAVS